MEPNWAILGWGAAVLIAVLLLTEYPRRRPPAYNALSEITVGGVVQQVREFYCPNGGDQACTQFIVKTQKGVIAVDTTPVLDHIKPSEGDQVEVVGAKVTYKGRDELIARKIILTTRRSVP